MNSNEIKLYTKNIGKIKGEFYVPSYQRGYRWRKEEVIRLLDDIYSTEGKTNYCLQPVVVKNMEGRYELIDGQQRLTTIYLIYLYLNKESGGFMVKPCFTLSYETREDTKEFLENIHDNVSRKDRKEKNIDFWFLGCAYETIDKWFSEKGEKLGQKQVVLMEVSKYLAENIQIIWYEVDKSEDEIELFTRLNIGKIPLTNAELIKATFLSDSSCNDVKNKREEIAFQWDNIEKDLHDDSLWYFLTNEQKADYQTRIDLVLDLMLGKPTGNKEKYQTFFAFDEKRKDKKLVDLWNEIQKTFLVLKGWRVNHELYHKIGYLIASKSKNLQKIYELSKCKTKTAFIQALDEEIRRSIKLSDDDELTYDKQSGRSKIEKLLLLFNVESVRRHGENSQWFPFDLHKIGGVRKDGKDEKVRWSLEHIHAQNSKRLTGRDAQIEWLDLHIKSLESIEAIKTDDDKAEVGKLIKKMKNDRDKIEKNKPVDFEEIQQKVFEFGFRSDGSSLYDVDSISNLALLAFEDNAALSNSTFDVKRNKILEMDKAGMYIPFCTRNVFLKYYTSSESNQIHFWGEKDRESYIKAINQILKDGYGVTPIQEKQDKETEE